MRKNPSKEGGNIRNHSTSKSLGKSLEEDEASCSKTDN